uniref:Uncharacterized protein n=1 Tax=Oryza meridionalis TaxID=40149 RepID=A0A0E0E996_9ORYZ
MSSSSAAADRGAAGGASSFRVYYSLGAAGTVPFVWESKPGTPKSTVVPASAADGGYAMPPISPPPSYSYQWSSCNSDHQPKAKKCRRRLSTSSCSWASSGGWMSWLTSFRRRQRWLPPSPGKTTYRRRWLGQDGGVAVDDVVVVRRSPPRRAVPCFGAGKVHW